MSSSGFTPINGGNGANWQGAGPRSSTAGSPAEIAREGARHEHDAEFSPSRELQEQQEPQRLRDVHDQQHRGERQKSSTSTSNVNINNDNIIHNNSNSNISHNDNTDQLPTATLTSSTRGPKITGLRTDRFPGRSSAELNALRGISAAAPATAMDGANEFVREESTTGATRGSDVDATASSLSAAAAHPSERMPHPVASPAQPSEGSEFIGGAGDPASHPRKQRRTGMDSKISVADAGNGGGVDAAASGQDFDMEDAITLKYDGQTASVGRASAAPFQHANNGGDDALNFQSMNTIRNDSALTTSATRAHPTTSHHPSTTQQRQQQPLQQQRPDNGDSTWYEPSPAVHSSAHGYPFIHERGLASGSMQPLPAPKYRHAGLPPVRARGFANLLASTGRARNRSPGPGVAARNGSMDNSGDSNDVAISVSGDIQPVPSAAERARFLAEDNEREGDFSRRAYDEPPPANSTRSRARRFSGNTNGSNRSGSLIGDTPERDAHAIPTSAVAPGVGPAAAAAAASAARDRKLREISAGSSFHMQTRNRGSSGSFSASQSSPPHNEDVYPHAPSGTGGNMNIIAATPSMMTRASTRGRPGYETLVSFAQMNGTRSGSMGSSSPRGSFGVGHEGPGQITLRTASFTPGRDTQRRQSRTHVSQLPSRSHFDRAHEHENDNGEDSMDQGAMGSSPTRIPSQKLLDALSDSVRRAIEADDMRLVHTLRFIQGRASTELGYLTLVDNALCTDEGMKEFKRAIRRVMRRVSKTMSTTTTTVDESAPSEQPVDDNGPAEAVDMQEYTSLASPSKRRERRRERQASERKTTAAVDPNLTESAEELTSAATMPMSTRKPRSFTPETPKITRTQSASSDHASTSSLSTAKSVDLAAEALTSTETEKLAATTTAMPVADTETTAATVGAASAVTTTTTATAAVGRRVVPRVAKKKKPQRYQKPYAKGVNNENLRGPVLSAAQQERYKEMDRLNNPERQKALRQDLPDLDQDLSNVRTPANGTTPVKETGDGPGARRKARLSAQAAAGARRPRYSRRREKEMELEEEELDEIQSPVDYSSSNEGEDDDDDVFASGLEKTKGSGRAAAARARVNSRALAKKRSRRSQGTQGLGFAGSSTVLKARRRGAAASPAVAGVSTRRATRASAPTSARQSSEPGMPDVHLPDATGLVADSSDNGAQINDDYCYLCGGSGELLCCDGCVHSFHFTCLDPPMDPENPPDGRWFCVECDDKYEAEQLAKAAARNRANAAAASTTNERVMSSLLENAEALQPSLFQLPASLRNYYAGNKTGDKGEYAPIAILPKKDQRRWAKTYASDERSNAHLYALTDNKGKFIFCFACGRTSGNNKPIQICSFCPCAWHLDCLPFPVANPPYQKPNSEKPYHHWKCPNHIDHDLRNIRSVAGRYGNFRRPRNPRWLDIDVIPTNEDFNAGPTGGHPSYYDEEDRDGIVYRVEEKALVMNFVERVKQENAMDAALKSYYRAIVERESPEWRKDQISSAPDDLLLKVTLELEKEAARDARRSGMQSRSGTRSEPVSIAASGANKASPSQAPSASESDAVMGLLAMSHTPVLPATVRENPEARQKSLENGANNEKLSGLLKQLVSINQADQPASESEASPAPQVSKPDQASDVRVEGPSDVPQGTSHPSDVASASGADDSKDRMSGPRQQAREEQLKRDKVDEKERSATPVKEREGKKRGHEETVSAEENPGSKSEVELLQSIQAYVAERMRALGGETTEKH